MKRLLPVLSAGVGLSLLGFYSALNWGDETAGKELLYSHLFVALWWCACALSRNGVERRAMTKVFLLFSIIHFVAVFLLGNWEPVLACGLGVVALALFLKENLARPVAGFVALFLVYHYFPVFVMAEKSALAGTMKISFVPEAALLLVSYCLYEVERGVAIIEGR